MPCETRCSTMARPKGRPKLPITAPPRATMINLKGTDDQVKWFNDIHYSTRIPKSSIMRLALTMWAERHGFAPFPESVEDVGLAEYTKRVARAMAKKKKGPEGGEGE